MLCGKIDLISLMFHSVINITNLYIHARIKLLRPNKVSIYRVTPTVDRANRHAV